MDRTQSPPLRRRISPGRRTGGRRFPERSITLQPAADELVKRHAEDHGIPFSTAVSQLLLFNGKITAHVAAQLRLITGRLERDLDRIIGQSVRGIPATLDELRELRLLVGEAASAAA
jgi:hypothetical protein